LSSVNVLSNSVPVDFSFYYCVHSVLSRLSRIAPNNSDSYKSSMYQNVQTCILEVNSTTIGIKLSKIFTPTRNALDSKHASQ